MNVEIILTTAAALQPAKILSEVIVVPVTVVMLEMGLNVKVNILSFQHRFALFLIFILCVHRF